MADRGEIMRRWQESSIAAQQADAQQAKADAEAAKATREVPSTDATQVADDRVTSAPATGGLFDTVKDAVTEYLSDPVAGQMEVPDIAPVPQSRPEATAAIGEETTGPTGAVQHIPGSATAFQEQYATAKDYPNEMERKRLAVENRLHVDLIPIEEHEDVIEPSRIESVGGVLELFDYPRRALWQLGNLFGETFLPEPTDEDDDPTLASHAGDFLQTVSGHLVANLIEAGTEVGMGETFLGVLPETVYDVMFEPNDETLNQIGENLYKASATGELRKAGTRRRGYELGLPFIDLIKQDDGSINLELPGESEEGEHLKGWTTPVPSGIDIIDAAVPPALAMKLAAEAETPAARWFFGNLTTHLGRESMGLGIEFTGDPLWFVGPAKAGQVAHMGGKAYNLGGPLARAAARAAELAGADVPFMSRKLIQMATGTEDEAKAAKKLFGDVLDQARVRHGQALSESQRAIQGAQDPARAVEEAQRAAQRAQNEAQSLIDNYRKVPGARKKLHVIEKHQRRLQSELMQMETPKEAARYLRTVAAKKAATAASRQKDVLAIQRALTLMERGGDVVEEAGTVAMHIPFGTQTYYLSKLGGKAMKGAPDFISSPLFRVYDAALDATGQAVSKVKDWSKPWSLEELAKLEGKAADLTGGGFHSTMFMEPGQRFAYAYHKATGTVGNFSRMAATTMSRVLGDRFIQPLITRAMFDAQLGALGGAGDGVWRFGFGGDNYQRMLRVPPEIWGDYQNSVTGFFNAQKSLEASLMKRIDAMTDSAHHVAMARRARAPEVIAETEAAITELEKAVAAAPDTKTAMALKTQLWRMRGHLESAKEWKRDWYGVQNVLNEAWNHHEAGSGRLFEDNSGLRAVVDEIDQLRVWYKDNLGKEIDRFNQSTAAMARWGKGDPARRDAIQEMLKHISRAQKELPTKVNQKIEALQTAANHRLKEIRGLGSLITDATPGRLDAVLRAIRIKVGHAPISPKQDDVIRQVLLDIFKGDHDAVHRVLINAAGTMSMPKGEDALRVFAEMVSLQSKAGPGKPLRAAIEELLADWGKEVKLLKRVSEGGFDPRIEPDIIDEIMNARLARSLAQAKAKVGGADWDAFVKWADSPAAEAVTAPSVSPTWIDARRDWLRLKMLAEVSSDARAGQVSLVRRAMKNAGIEGRKEGILSSERLFSERIRRSLEGATIEAEAARAVRAALDDLLPTHKPMFAKVADELAAKIAARWAGGEKPLKSAAAARVMAAKALRGAAKEKVAATRAAGKRMKKSLAEREAALRIELEEVKPRFEIPTPGDDGMPTSRDMKKWEEDLFRKFNEITEGLDPDEVLKAGFSALRFGPENPQWLQEHYDELSKAYGQVVGTRFDELPEDMNHVVRHIRSIVASYEDLYAKYGMGFMKDPTRRLRDWGTVAYAPHIVDKKYLAQKGIPDTDIGRYMDSGILDDAVSSLDRRLALGIDADKLRSIRGTVMEINAAATDEAVHFTLDPGMVTSRYMQSNRSISSTEFLSGLVHGKVAKHFPDPKTAADADYVPLFDRASDADHPFAAFAKDIPEVAQASAIEEIIGKGIDPRPMFVDELSRLSQAAPKGTKAVDLETKAWETVAKRVNAEAKGPRTEGKFLKDYFEVEGESVTQLYVPNAVYQSMRDLFEMKGDKILSTGGMKTFRAIQNMWKSRITVTSVAFTARNIASNILSNILDVGVHGALSPKTNKMASQITMAAQYADTFGAGSLSEAYKVLQTPITDTTRAGMLARGIDNSKRIAALSSFKAAGLDDMVLHGIDFGDGAFRGADEALAILRDRGVLSEAFTQFVDITQAEQKVLGDMMSGSITGKLKKAASVTEDAFFTIFPYAMVNPMFPMPPIGLPKAWGEVIARQAENQGRMVNFIANMRRSGSVELSAQHVAKFLFDYGDLTSVQRNWMRLLIPFFTWTQKNIMLQGEMMMKSPNFYSKFNQIMTGWGYALNKDLRADADSFVPRTDENDERALSARPSYTLSRMRTPLGGNQYLEGYGTPIEAAVEQMGMLAAGLDFDRTLKRAAYHGDKLNATRLLATASFLPRFMAEVGLHRSFFRNAPLRDQTNASLVAEYLAGFNKMGWAGQATARYLEELTGYHEVYLHDRNTGTMEIQKTVTPGWNHLVSNLPWSRVIRDASALSELYHLSLGANTLLQRNLSQEGGVYEEITTEVPLFWRILDAYTGLRVTQESMTINERIRDYHLKKAMSSETTSRGATYESTETRPVR